MTTYYVIKGVTFSSTYFDKIPCLINVNSYISEKGFFACRKGKQQLPLHQSYKNEREIPTSIQEISNLDWILFLCRPPDS